MQTMNRREFMKRTGATLAWLAMPSAPLFPGQPESETLPTTSLGRITTWWRQAVRKEPSQEAEWVAWKTRDQVIPLHAAVVGRAPWPNNPIC